MPKLTPPEVKPLYVRWLRGESLRAIAASLPPERACSHNTIKRRFARLIGPHATDPRATSLARAILSDYPDDPGVEAWALEAVRNPEQQRHYSRHNLKQLTLWQTARNDVVLEIEAAKLNEPDPTPAPLSMALLCLTYDAIAALLADFRRANMGIELSRAIGARVSALAAG